MQDLRSYLRQSQRHLIEHLGVEKLSRKVISEVAKMMSRNQSKVTPNHPSKKHQSGCFSFSVEDVERSDKAAKRKVLNNQVLC